MTDIAELGLVIRSDGVVVAKDRLRDFEAQADSTERRAVAMGAVVGRVLAALATAMSVSQIVAYADAWSDMQSRVGAAVKNMDAAPALMKRMVDLANASYSPLQQTVEVFTRNVGVLRDLGYAANEAADYTEALNHALVVTATRGERAESVQNALSKAMATGKLQADGLESVLANGGRVAEALATQLDTTVSGLRAMASDGKITSDVIATALITSLEQLREEAAAMPATVADAFTRLQTNITALIGQFDQATGATSAIVGVIMGLADNLNMVVPVVAGLAATITTAMVPSLYAAATGMWAFTAALLANPLTWVAIAVGGVVAAIVILIQRMGGVQEAFLAVRTTATDVWERIKAGGQSLAAYLGAVATGIAASFASAWADILAGFIGMMNSIAGAGNPMSMGAAGGWLSAKTTANSLQDSSNSQFASASSLWGKATGPGAAMDNIGLGADWGQLQETFAGATVAANDLTTAIGPDGVGGAMSAANDNVKAANETIWEMTDALGQLGAAAVDPLTTLASQLRDLDDLLAQGKISWEEYGEAAYRANAGAVTGVLGLASGMTGALAQMFQDNKAFAIANAVVSTAEAVMKALATYGPTPWGFAAAGVAAATGAAQIATIMSAQKGSSSVSKPGAAGSASEAQAAPVADRAAQINLTLGGSGRYSREEVVDLIEQLADGINDGVDGGKFKIAVNS